MTRSAVLLTVDALRRDHLTCYDDAPASTDAIERFATDGATVLESFWSGGCVTGRSFRTVFSGAPDFSRGRRNVTYPSDRPALPEFLPDDVTTIGVSSNVNVSAAGGWAREWDVFHDFAARSNEAADGGVPGNGSLEDDEPPAGFGFDGLRRRASDALETGPVGVQEWIQTAYRYYNLRSGSLPFPDGESVLAATERLLAEANPPVLLWVHLMEPHTPWLPLDRPGQYDSFRVARAHGRMERNQRRLDDSTREYLRELYARRVEAVDAVVGDVLATVESSLGDETLVWLFADHGEELGESGWFGHGHMGAPRRLVPALTRIPGIVRAPGMDVDPTRPWGHADVAPTLSDWFDASVTPEADGTSLFEDPDERHVWSVCDGSPVDDRRSVACVTDQWRFVRTEADGSVDRQLFDLTGRPYEDVASDRPGVVERFDALATDRSDVDDADARAVDDALQQRLRDLGYR